MRTEKFKLHPQTTVGLLCNWNLWWKRNFLSFPPPVSRKFPRCELLWNRFPQCGGNCFSRPGILFPYLGNNFPISSECPLNFPRFPNDSYWSPPLIPQFPVQFSTQLHKCRLHRLWALGPFYNNIHLQHSSHGSCLGRKLETLDLHQGVAPRQSLRDP